MELILRYKIKTMSEIDSIKRNGFKVVSTFSGCGGSCLGYRMAGYDVIWANEFIEEAQKTYKANHPSSYLCKKDVRTVTPNEILSNTGLKKGELDIFDGSPPCSAFSTCGQREKGWNKEKKYSDKSQRVDDLFFEYTRLLEGLKPKVFIAENVSGLVKGKAKGYFKLIVNELRSKGYNVGASVLNAMYLGVPQSRERVIFIGVRDDLNIKPSFPKPLKHIFNLKDAIYDLDVDTKDSIKMEIESQKYKWCSVLKMIEKNPSKVIKGSSVMNGSYFNLSRLSWNKPSDTICQMNGDSSASGNCHPSRDRKLNINELKRVCSFPDDFVLTGTFKQQWERLGRSVPPVMMMNISKHVEKEILCKIK